VAIDGFGPLLREWRAALRLSQLELALKAGMSARHLSFVETGRAHPSREMIARLADTLGVPLRERNALLIAAGYAPVHPETGLDARELAPVRRAIAFILDHQEPYPAFVLDRRWDVLAANRAAGRIGEYLCGGSAHTNMVRRFVDPNDLRAAVVNWEEVASELIRHLQDEVSAAPWDTKARVLLEEVLRYPGVPHSWQTRELGVAPAPLLTVVFRRDHQELRFFSTITRFGSPRDVTLEELRLECSFPADAATAELCRAIADEGPVVSIAP
jgi:transcriptional regulator with XRE-family HTH domain